jgi:hypothetical protein
VPRHPSFLLKIKITILSLSLPLSYSLSPSFLLFLSLWRVKRVCAPCSPVRERERDREREREMSRGLDVVAPILYSSMEMSSWSSFVHQIFSLSLSFSDIWTGCAHPLHPSERERERERGSEREIKREIKREREWERGRESCMHEHLSLSLWPVTARTDSKHSSFIQSVSMGDYYIN